MSEETVSIEYRIPRDRILHVREGGRRIRLGSVTDARGGDPCRLMPKNVGGGMPSGSYVTDRPVAEILARALDEALAVSGAAGAGPDALELSATITAFEFSVMVGFARCMLRGRLAADVALKDPRTGEIVFSSFVEGNGHAGVGALVREALASTMDDFLVKLLYTPGFLNPAA